jgi:hypothetical protein
MMGLGKIPALPPGPVAGRRLKFWNSFAEAIYNPAENGFTEWIHQVMRRERPWPGWAGLREGS